MNTLGFVFMLLSIWVLSSFWFLAYSSDARVNPFVSIDSDPVIPTETEPPIYLIPSQMAPQSTGVADGRVAHHQEMSKTILVTLIIASSLVAVILLSLLLFHLFRKTNMKNSNSKSKPVQDSIKGLPLGPIVGKFSKNGSVASIEYQFLVAATNGFGKDNILGEGEFGFLYKAQFKSNVLAAVKRIESGTLDAEKEFQNEVDWLSKLSHQNIVSLLGYCFRSDFKFLVYEMVHNGPLESHLHGPSHGSNLTWHLRMKIALDIARGLEFLHERCNPPVIHRDLTSSNILLDYKFNAKLSAFGQAIASGSRTKENLKLSLTMGYVAPEYLSDGKLTDKSDVYAFGVILLELLTGRKAFEKTSSPQQQSIVTWAMPHLSDRLKLPSIIDPTIRDTMDLKHLYQVAAIAVLCVQPEPSYRPLITDVLHSFIPLVPHELGGSLRISVPVETSNSN